MKREHVCQVGFSFLSLTKEKQWQVFGTTLTIPHSRNGTTHIWNGKIGMEEKESGISVWSFEVPL
jgi:hypothetical protein